MRGRWGVTPLAWVQAGIILPIQHLVLTDWKGSTSQSGWSMWLPVFNKMFALVISFDFKYYPEKLMLVVPGTRGVDDEMDPKWIKSWSWTFRTQYWGISVGIVT